MDPAGRTPAHGLVLALALAAPLALVAAGRAFEPDARGWGTHEQLGFRPCYPMAHWDVPCPGCGVTTSVAHLARGELAAASRAQPLGPVLALGTVAAAGWALGEHLRGRDAARGLARLPWRLLGRVAGALVLVAWLYKLVAVRAGG